MPAVLATLAAPLLLYFIARTTVTALSIPGSIGFAALPPADFLPLTRRLAAGATHPNFNVNNEMAGIARNAARTSPLAYEPFFVAARYAAGAGREQEATRLLEEARLRRASHLPTRMHLLVNYARARRYLETLAELDVVLRLSNDVRTILIPELTKLLTSADGREALAQVLAREPTWREYFVRVASGQKLNPAHTGDLLSRVRALKRGGDVGLEQELFFNSLLNQGDYARARSIWLRSLRPTERTPSATLFDGSFRGLTAPAPFSWALQDVDVGRAEIVSDEGQSHLDITYFGGRNIVLAEQIIALEPGTYRLRTFAKSAEGVKDASLSWRMTCLPERQELAVLGLDHLTERYSPVSNTFTVPAKGCPGQRLALVAEAGDVSGVSNVQVSRLEIER